MKIKTLLHLLGLGVALLSTLAGAHAQPVALISTNTAWRFLDDGSDQGTAWRGVGFNDSGWSNGVPLFGVESQGIYPWPIRTPMVLGGGRITYYFRTHFQWSDSAAGAVLTASNYVDDGAVYYLNGVEAGRVRITAEPVAFNSLAVVSTEGVLETVTLAASNLVAGDNVLAVELHQTSLTSSDIIFGLTLEGRPPPDTTPPTLVSAAANCASNTVTATFSEPLTPASATDPFNYQISGGVAIQSLALGADGRTVSLSTGPLTPGVPYTLKVNGVMDLAGNPIAPDSRAAFSCPASPILITCASNKTVECGAAWTFDSPTASGGPCVSNIITIVNNTSSGVCTQVFTRTWRATAVCQPTNFVECSQTVTVRDTTAPALTCPANKTVVCDPVTVLHEFATDGMDGQRPHGALLEGRDDFLYGTTAYGGITNVGTLFRVKKYPDTSGYTVLRNFGMGQGGRHPSSGLAEGPDGLLYGVTPAGGNNGVGTVFEWNSGTTGYTVLRQFSTTDNLGHSPTGGVIVASDGWLYGTTTAGGTNDRGTVFKLNTNGAGYTVLRHFVSNANPADGNGPQGPLWEGRDGFLYGVTQRGGGSGGGGTVFKLNTNGAGYTVLRRFSTTGGDGQQPNGALVEDDEGWLHGTTRLGGLGGRGIIFMTHRDGTNYAGGTNFIVLHDFAASGAEGSEPTAGVVFGPDDALYGTTSTNGPGGGGTLFRKPKRPLSNQGYTVLRSFEPGGSDGNGPTAGLTLGRDGAFYGSTERGGSNNAGTLFKLEWPCPWTFDEPIVADACCGGTNVTLTTVSTVTNGSCPQVITRTWRATDCCSNSAPCSQTVSVIDGACPPVILAQPQSQTVTQGQTVTLSITVASVSPLRYQWHFNGAALAGATNATLTFAASLERVGGYTVAVGNLQGELLSEQAAVLFPFRDKVGCLLVTFEVGPGGTPTGTDALWIGPADDSEWFPLPQRNFCPNCEEDDSIASQLAANIHNTSIWYDARLVGETAVLIWAKNRPHIPGGFGASSLSLWDGSIPEDGIPPSGCLIGAIKEIPLGTKAGIINFDAKNVPPKNVSLPQVDEICPNGPSYQGVRYDGPYNNPVTISFTDGGGTHTQTFTPAATDTDETICATVLAWLQNIPINAVSAGPTTILIVEPGVTALSCTSGNANLVIGSYLECYECLSKDGCLVGLVNEDDDQSNGDWSALVDVDPLTGNRSNVRLVQEDGHPLNSLMGLEAPKPGSPGPANVLYTVTKYDGEHGTHNTLYKIDRITGLATRIGAGLNLTGGIVNGDLSFHPNGTLYGVAKIPGFPREQLFTINLTTGAGTIVGEIPGVDRDIRSIAFGAGILPTLIAVDNASQEVLTIPLGNLSAFTSVPLGTPYVGGAMDYDPGADKFYLINECSTWCPHDLMTLNPSSGAISPVSGTSSGPSFPLGFCGLARVRCACDADLMIGDTSYDNGIEPNPDPVYPWDSPNIYVRNQQDGLINTTHENPLYRNPNLQNPSYVYVRVYNRGCEEVTADVEVHATTGATGAGWPTDFTDTTGGSGNPYPGMLIGTVANVTVAPESIRIVFLPWYPPYPLAPVYDDLSHPGHWCFIARLGGIGMTYPEISWVGANVINNNNIAQKNVSVVKQPLGTGNWAGVVVRNSESNATTATLQFITSASPTNSLLQDGALLVDLRSHFDRWMTAGRRGTGLEVVSNNLIRIVANNATIPNLPLAPGAFDQILVRFDSSTTNLGPEGRTYTLDIRDQRPLDGTNVGTDGYRFVFNVQEPPIITAQPQSLTVTQGQAATFSVTALGAPPLSYQWRFNEIAISGATNATYTISNVQTNDGGVYDVVVANAFGAVRSASGGLDVQVCPSYLDVTATQAGAVNGCCCWTFNLFQRGGSHSEIVRVTAQVPAGVTVCSASGPGATIWSANSQTIDWSIPGGLDFSVCQPGMPTPVQACFSGIGAVGATINFRGYDAQGNTTGGFQDRWAETVTIGANGECACPPLQVHCPGNITLPTCNASRQVCYQATASGGCPPVSITYNPPSCSWFAAGTTTPVTATATDANGHTATCTFTVTIVPVTGFWQLFPAGVPDCYQLPYEPAFRRPCLNAAYPSALWKNFDDPQVNRFFGLSWNLPFGTYQDGWLVTRMKDYNCSGNSVNDSISLGLLTCDPAVNPKWKWGRHLGTSGGQPAGLYPTDWCNIPGCNQLFFLNLSALPLVGGGTDTVIPNINAPAGAFPWQRRFDMFVQDDTRVDFAWLWLRRCLQFDLVGGVEVALTNAHLVHGPGSWTLAREAGSTNGFSGTFDLGEAEGVKFNFQNLRFGPGTGRPSRNPCLALNHLDGGTSAELFRLVGNTNGTASLHLGQPLPGVTNLTVDTLSNGVVVATRTVLATAGAELGRYPESNAVQSVSLDNRGGFSVRFDNGPGGTNDYEIQVRVGNVSILIWPLTAVTLAAEGLEQITLGQPQIGMAGLANNIIVVWPNPSFGDAVARVENGQFTLSALNPASPDPIGIEARLGSPTNEFRATIATSFGEFSPESSSVRTNASLSLRIVSGGDDDSDGGDKKHKKGKLVVNSGGGLGWRLTASYSNAPLALTRVEVFSNGTNIASVANPATVELAALPPVYAPSIVWLREADICHRLLYGDPVTVRINGTDYTGTELRVMMASNGPPALALFGLSVEATGADALVLARLEAGAPLDGDYDGLPDAWETAHGLNPNDPSDAEGDLDGDGLTNLEEYLAGTDPNNPGSTLRVEALSFGPDGSVRLRFQAMPDRSYEVESASSLGGDNDWSTVSVVPAQPAARTVEVTVPPNGAATRFFRVRQ